MMQAPYQLRFTQFALIDEAMIKVIKAQVAYEEAQYSVGERGAMEDVLNAAANLKAVFLAIEKEINEEYAQYVSEQQFEN